MGHTTTSVTAVVGSSVPLTLALVSPRTHLHPKTTGRHNGKERTLRPLRQDLLQGWARDRAYRGVMS